MNVRLPSFVALFLCLSIAAHSQNRDPLSTKIVTSDLDNFWKALEKAGPDVDAKTLNKLYLKRGSKGIKGFMKGRIESAENLSNVIKSHQKYYRSIKVNTDSIPGMKDQIRQSLVKLKDLYPEAIFPPVYFVIGALNSGGTSSNNGLIIGAEMYGLTAQTPKDELNNWLLTVLQPVNQIPHIVAHELIHFQQTNRETTLLAASIREGSADFLAELISGRHINQHVHDFANPKEKELWLEFRERMDKNDYQGWLYSSAKDRPNDLGYWMGYKIVESYYDQATDKKAAIHEILNIREVNSFLEQSGYPDKFK